MKKTKQLLLNAIFVMATITSFAQIGVGTDDPKATLDVVSTNSGVIVPRVANAAAVTSPKNGMVIYDLSLNCFNFYENDAWNNCLSSPAIMTFDSVNAYNGVSVIDSQGVGYNGEAVPAASTIDVDVTTTSRGTYSFVATDATTGLEYTATGDFNSAGSYVVTLSNNGATIPATTSGVISMTLSGASNTLVLEPRIDVKSIPASATTVFDVTYGTQKWMDRNLGARRVATASDDVFSYGNYYQWGRPADGHEITVLNGTTHTSGRGFADVTALEDLATSDAPGHPNFITTDVDPYDWRNGNNDDRWNTASQGPCPAGYHVPTQAEWTVADAAAIASGNGTNGGTTTGWDNNVETYESTLKLPTAGYRGGKTGNFSTQGTNGYYWSSTIASTIAYTMYFSSTDAYLGGGRNANGIPVRCIKN